MKFANLDRVLYQYRQHAHQIMKVNQKQILDNSNVITRKHLLKFGISMDPKTKCSFFWLGEIRQANAKKNKENYATQTISIKNFYDYPSVDKKKFFTGFCSALKSLWIKENNISKQQLELASVPLREKKTISTSKKKITAIKSISCNHGECFKQKRYTVFI